jgi:hypothetical protein
MVPVSAVRRKPARKPHLVMASTTWLLGHFGAPGYRDGRPWYRPVGAYAPALMSWSRAARRVPLARRADAPDERRLLEEDGKVVVRHLANESLPRRPKLLPTELIRLVVMDDFVALISLGTRGFR